MRARSYIGLARPQITAALFGTANLAGFHFNAGLRHDLSREQGQGHRIVSSSRAAAFGKIILALLVAAFALYALVRTQIPERGEWYRHVVSETIAGHPVPPGANAPGDFYLFWSQERMAWSGYARGTDNYSTLRQAQRHPSTWPGAWPYPPPTIFLTLLTRFGSFGESFLIWTGTLIFLSIFLLARAGIPWPVIFATIISPASVWNMSLGQLGLISGALFVATLAWAINRPVKAGIGAGLLVLKPQAGLLLPIVFLARLRFGAILIAAATIAALAAVTTARFGIGIWATYLRHGTHGAYALLVGPAQHNNHLWGVSVFWMARSLGLNVPSSIICQVTASLVAVIWCGWAWRDPSAAPLPRIALTTCLAMLVTPYAYVDDLCAFSLGVALLAWNRGNLRFGDLAFWAWPAFSGYFTGVYHLELAPVVILVAALRAHIEMHDVTPGRRRLQSLLDDSSVAGHDGWVS